MPTDAINAPVPDWLEKLHRLLDPKGPSFKTALELHIYAYERETLLGAVSSMIQELSVDAGRVPPLSDWPAWLRESTLGWGVGSEKDGYHALYKIRMLTMRWHTISHAAEDVIKLVQKP